MVTKPSAVLTRDCDSPKILGPLYKDGTVLILEQAEALEECTSRMRALRK